MFLAVPGLPGSLCRLLSHVVSMDELVHVDLGMLLGSEVYCMDFPDLSYTLHMSLYSLYEDER